MWLPGTILIFAFVLSGLAAWTNGLSSSSSFLKKARSLYSTNCTNDSECIVNSYCYYGRCTCKNNFIPFKESVKAPIKCIKHATDIEDYCEKDIQCQVPLGTHAFCQMADPTEQIGKCNCTMDAHYIDNLCYKTAYIGQSCEVNDNCLVRNRNIKTFCDYGHCICPPHYHPIDGGKDCVPTSELNGPCISSDSCITSFSGCRNGFCQCQNNFIMNFDNSTCLQVAVRLGDPCDEDRQCLLNIQKSRCDLTQATCACQDGFHQMEGECWKTASLFQPCMHHNECKLDNHHGEGVECLTGFCQCKEGYLISDDRKFCYDNGTMKAFDKGSGMRVHQSLLSVVVLFGFSQLVR